MLDRRPVDPGLVRVTFRVPNANGSTRAFVVGDFNGWSRDADEMVRVGDEFVATLHLAAGSTYRFRYLVDGDQWQNDHDADSYVRNDFGGDDSVIDLRDAAAGGDETRQR